MANGDIRPARFVELQNASGQARAIEANANEKVIGISMNGTNKAPIPDVTSTNAAESGQHLRVHVQGEETLLELGGTVAAAAFIKSDADGKGVAALTTGTVTQEIGAVALESGVSGELIRVKVQLHRHRPAIA
jgi:hypothetical protein|tara:strand:+ start:3264 stop:3662 length:399 start_codon:yes stop_codon:yes gene_type:complete